ncbi:MAG: hypothetical protein WCL00_01425 [Bacteroidota bacterium]
MNGEISVTSFPSFLPTLLPTFVNQMPSVEGDALSDHIIVGNEQYYSYADEGNL